MSYLTVTPRGVVLIVHAVPRSSTTALQGQHGDAIKIRLQAPPVKGKANVALIRFLSRLLGIPPRQVRLILGESGRRKRVLVSGLGEAAIRKKLGL